MSIDDLKRREFLKLFGAGVGAAAFPVVWSSGAVGERSLAGNADCR